MGWIPTVYIKEYRHYVVQFNTNVCFLGNTKRVDITYLNVVNSGEKIKKHYKIHLIWTWKTLKNDTKV